MTDKSDLLSVYERFTMLYGQFLNNSNCGDLDNHIIAERRRWAFRAMEFMYKELQK